LKLNSTSSTSATWPYSARNCNLRFHIVVTSMGNEEWKAAPTSKAELLKGEREYEEFGF
jgi:hypothetical protein